MQMAERQTAELKGSDDGWEKQTETDSQQQQEAARKSVSLNEYREELINQYLIII